ncbi:hypothetical protein [Thiolapillus sp.]|uniref:hypothetical protein n=6 Tax=Thiolapillus sp. TaxID=2017437 RepID=UPI0025FE77DB|nr:hypothetical protein [Thiolapillus sp.]
MYPIVLAETRPFFKRVFGLVIDFGTSQSPKSTQPLTTYLCPSRPGHQALRNNFASSLLLRTWLPYDWTPRSEAYFVFPLAQGTPGKQCGLAATGVYQPSLRSPWLAADDIHEIQREHDEQQSQWERQIAVAQYACLAWQQGYIQHGENSHNEGKKDKR